MAEKLYEKAQQKLVEAEPRANSGTNEELKLVKTADKNASTFKAVDEIYDAQTRKWKLVECSLGGESDIDCVFVVRRSFDLENTLQGTHVDIHSKHLQSALQMVFKSTSGQSLVGSAPSVCSRALFHGYNDFRAYVEAMLKPSLKTMKRRKERKHLAEQIAHCRLLLDYIEEDYAKVQAKLKPMLKAGVITFDLIWALFKPNTIAVTSTHANKDELRCFRASHECEYGDNEHGVACYLVKGEYLDNDGDRFGMAKLQAGVQQFKGQVKIASLAVYPLEHHKETDVSARMFRPKSHI
jgi:hypothetical protein